MVGVRRIAGICWALGWVTVVIAVIGLLGAAVQIASVVTARVGPLALVGLLTGALPLLGIAVVPFFLWAVLTGLCSVHEQGERMVTLLQQQGDGQRPPQGDTLPPRR